MHVTAMVLTKKKKKKTLINVFSEICLNDSSKPVPVIYAHVYL